MDLVVRIGTSDDSSELGGKGASLDRLRALGFPVPEGFVITTEGVKSLTSGDARAGELVASSLSELSGTHFAVRSSSVAEDTSKASMAGMHETSLWVEADQVGPAIERTIESARRQQAESYRQARGVGSDEMAVVIQEMVPADASAVLFTRHPVSGDDSSMMVNATVGLGEPLVSGEITPDSFVVSKDPLEIVERKEGAKEFALVGVASGIVRKEGPFPEPALTPQEVLSLCELGSSLEGRLGYAVDIEAALKQGDWWLLQARPITT